jgi:hypothetical protein
MKDNRWQYMFLCQNCLANSTIALNPKEESVQLAFVVVSAAPGYIHGCPGPAA